MSTSCWTKKTAVICGGSAGLGKEFARELGRQQVARLALVARSLDGLTAVREALLSEHRGLQILCLAADLRDKSQLQQVADQIYAEFGSIDLLIQAVGQSDRGRLADLTDARLQELIAMNVLTSLHAVQCFAPIMQPSGSNLILIGSLASKFAPRFLGGYAVAKHGLSALAQQARLELAEQGIHVLLACPGPIARPDAGGRYDQLTSDQNLPESARRPGGGAKVKGLNATLLVRQILQAAARKQPQLIRPAKAQWLVWLSAWAPAWGERLLRRNSG